MQTTRCAVRRALLNAGIRIETSSAMIPTTTSSSTNVKPGGTLRDDDRGLTNRMTKSFPAIVLTRQNVGRVQATRRRRRIENSAAIDNTPSDAGSGSNATDWSVS